MNRLSRGLVMDASVGIKTCLGDPLTPVAKAIIQLSKNEPTVDLVVPDLFFVECANILCKMSRFGGLPQTEATHHLQFLSTSPMTVEAHKNFIDEALAIGFQFSISAYDALYVAIADRMHLPLVTADEKLVKKVSTSQFNVIGLSDIIIP